MLTLTRLESENKKLKEALKKMTNKAIEKQKELSELKKKFKIVQKAKDELQSKLTDWRQF